jgi:[citrate (pro-3S)-lyase] ligase
LDENLDLDVVDLDSESETLEVADFLARFGLGFEERPDYAVVLRLAGKMAGTGSFKGEVLRNLAVRDDLRGLGLTKTLVTALMREQTRRGIVHFFVFTKPGNAHMFSELGFKEIAGAPRLASLLETGIGSLGQWCRETAEAVSGLPSPRAALVMNCNPYTLGHEALIEKASRENEAVLVLVVREDLSFFPFADRFRLVEEGAEKFQNVRVLPSGRYIISQATFPTYFLKEEDRAEARSALDLGLFAEKIAPALAISRRYAGEEPLCPLTRKYNEAMLKILPPKGVEVVVTPRVTAGEKIISATYVREAFQKRDWAALADLAPKNTIDYLRSLAKEDPGRPEPEKSDRPPRRPGDALNRNSQTGRPEDPGAT